MRKLTYFVASTIDGYIAAADGSVGFFAAGGDHSAAVAAQYPETLPAKIREVRGISAGNSAFDTVVMGRKTHDFGVRTGTSSPYSHLRQLVVSATLPEAPDPAIELIRTDPLRVIRGLKKEKGLGIWLCGGGELASQLLPEIDQIFLKLHPVVLGQGRPLFGGALPGPATGFHVNSSRVYNDGVAFIKYSRH